MYALEFYDAPYWWLFPLVMIILCFLVMRSRWGSMMCGFRPREKDNDKIRSFKLGHGDPGQEVCF